jgi:hypothetical protein
MSCKDCADRFSTHFSASHAQSHGNVETTAHASVRGKFISTSMTKP